MAAKYYDENPLSGMQHKYVSKLKVGFCAVPARYLLGFYDYMLKLIAIVRTDEYTEIELQQEDTSVPICM